MPPIELNIRFPKPTQVSVHFDGDETEPLDFQTPIGPEDYADIAWYLETYATHYITDVDIDRADHIAKRLKTLGENLFLSVFADATAKRLFDRFQDTDEKRLITLYAQHPAVLSLPWELLRPPKQTYLMHEKLSIRRRYLGAGGGRTAYKVSSKDRLRVLFVVSRPSDANFINPRTDALAVMHAIKTTQANIELEFLRPATLDKLINRLENDRLPPIDILHFDGHGAFFNAAAEPTSAKRADNPLSKQAQPESNNGYLLFETADGNNDFVSAETLADALYRKKIALVVLSACQSAAMGDDALTSVAARLTHAGLPSVLAMSYSVLVRTTEHLFGEFYNALMQGQAMGAALDTARRALNRHPERGERQCGDQRITLNLQDWFVPVLYQASHDCALLNPQTPNAHDSPPAINNLPKLQDAGFFGRSQELWQIERAFVQNVRSLAIVGFGGQGKTTLAIAAGDWLQQTGLFARVCFVDYAAFQGVDAVEMALSTLATVLQASLLNPAAATSALEKTATLVILDNVEALTPQVSAALLTAAAAWVLAGNSRVLITTRQHDLAHPAYPTAHTSQHLYLRLQGLGPEDALAYFQRLHKLPPAPLYQAPERAALLALFKRVDFHPLSISLLAGALKVTRLANLGPRLEHYLAENPGNPLLGSLKLSLDRLPADVRLLVPRLGVFQGGAMEDILLKITEINADDWAVLRPALAYTGLIQSEALTDVSVPYLKFHPTLAPALWQELTDSEQAGLLARYRHRYYQLSGYLYDKESQNLRVVRAIALRELPNCLHGVYTALQAGEAFAVEFADNVSRFLNVFGLQADKAALNKAVLAVSVDIGTESWYLAQTNQGQALFDAEHYESAASIFETLRLQLGQTPSYRLCTTLNHLGRCFHQLGNTAAAIGYYQQALALAQQLESSRSTQQLISTLHTDLADAFLNDGDYAQAQTQYGLSLAIAGEIGDTLGVALAQMSLGTLELLQGDLSTAEQSFKTALNLFSDLHEPQSEATAWHQLGYLYDKAKAWTAAEQAYREAARIQESIGDTLGAARTWNNLAVVAATLDQTDTAEHWFRKTITVLQQGTPKNLAASLNNLAALLQKQAGRLEEARELAEQALTIRKTLDAASAAIWTTYHILADIAEKQHASAQASDYRQSARDSYLGFAGMPTQIQAAAGLIAAVQQAVLTDTVEPELAAFLQDSQQSRPHVVTAIEQLLNGERNPAVLLEPLGFGEAAIIHLILTAIAQPDSL